MHEDKSTDKLLQRLSAQIGYLTAENIELNIMIEELREENASLKLNQNINNHIEQIKQEELAHE
jgi:hypothetical protein